MSAEMSEIRLLVSIVFHSGQGAVYGSKDSTEGVVVRGEGEYVVVKSLVM